MDCSTLSNVPGAIESCLSGTENTSVKRRFVLSWNWIHKALLSVHAGKYVWNWGRVNVGAVPRKMTVCRHILQNILFMPSTQLIVSYGSNKWLHLFININQLDALNFIISLFQASTCFEHMCSSSGGQNCIIQSGITTPIYIYIYRVFHDFRT